MPKIVFFNHFHKGDMHTHKEFVRHIRTELFDYEFEYRHKNPEKLLRGLDIPTVANLDNLEYNMPFYQDDGILYINTWVGCFWDVFCKHGGINMHTLHEQWSTIFDTINAYFNENLKIKTKEEYLPTMDYNLFDVATVDAFIEKHKDKRKVLICNNVPQSGQSFASTMAEYIIPIASADKDTLFICTNRIDTNGNDNIIFTGDIIGSSDATDLIEISYLSTYCDVIIGKNSGPYVFSETYQNYMDGSKTFVSLNTKHKDYDDIKETMSNGVAHKCRYITVPIVNTASPTQTDQQNIYSAIVNALGYEEA